MATGNTTLLKLALPVTGELSGTWGDTVNDSITSLLDSAVAGTTTLSADADVTLSDTALASNQARQAIILWTASNGATTRNITAPARSKVYIVVNAGTGSIVVRGAGPTAGVTVVAGERCAVAWNGSDFVKIGGTGGAGDFTTLSVSGSATFSGGTANGVAYLNGSKVLTTGSALTFDGTNFATTGSGTLKNLLLSGGTLPGAGNPSIALRSSDNVIYHQSGSANTIVMLDSAQNTMQSIGATAQIWNISNSEQMRLTSTGLGIGTSSPGYKLSVATTTDHVGLYDTDITGLVHVLSGNGNTSLYIGADNGNVAASSNLIFGVDGTERARIDSSGNLGLGVTPSAWASTHKALQMNWSAFSTDAGNGETSVSTNAFASAASTWNYRSTAPASRYTQDYYGKHIWFTAPSGTAGNAISFTQAMTLDASGRLGLGITNPSLSFEVGQNAAKGYMHSGVGVFSVGTSTNHPYAFDINGTERARITSGGNLLVGTTTAGASGTSVTVYDSTQSEIRLQNSTTGTGVSAGLQLAIAGTTAYLWNIANGPLVFAANNAERARISAAGGFSVGTTADPGAGAIYATGNITAYYSDQRLKTVSGRIENALDKVDSLSGVYYTNNDVAKAHGYTSEDVQVGVLAQEVEAVLPQVVKAAPFDLDENGNSKSGENYKTVQYDRLVPLLIEAIKELRAKVKELKGA